jgi:FtsH-binding integral membrane protein
MDFVRKVFGLVAIYLTITVVFASLAINSAIVRYYMIMNDAMFLLMFVVAIATVIALVFYIDNARRYPYNYYLLFAFTVAESYFVAWT